MSTTSITHINDPAPSHRSTRRALQAVWLAALLTATATTTAVAPAHGAESQGAGHRYYLSLGDSLAFGFQRTKALSGQPPEAFDTGYADLLAARIKHGNHPLTLVNYGCPGESTTTYLAGPCPWTAAGRALHDPFSGPQQAAAIAFLHDHHGQVDLVTLSLWGNDANPFVASCNANVACILNGAPALIASIAANLSTALAGIHNAAPDARVVLLGAIDVNIGAFALTHPLIRRLNAVMADVAAAHQARFANPFPIFNPDGDTGAALCALTLLCSDGDIHPSDAGYSALAELIQAQLQHELP
jgi:lysophospholipase L1-like esterase